MPNHTDTQHTDTSGAGGKVGSQAERVILGTALMSPAALADLRTTINADHFGEPIHAYLWQRITAAADADNPTTVEAIHEQLLRDGGIRRLPHPVYLFDLYQVGMPAQAEWWARQLRADHQRRVIAHDTLSLEAAQLGDEPNLAKVAELAARIADTAAADPNHTEQAPTFGDLVENYIAGYLDYRPDTAHPTPWHDLNLLFPGGGFPEGGVITFGAESGHGKSIALSDCARHMSVINQTPAVLVSLEMRAEDIRNRILAGLVGVNERAIRDRNLTDEEMRRVDAARARCAAAPLWIVEGAGYTASDIEAEYRRIEQRHGRIPILIVDYCQLVEPEGKVDNRQDAVSQVMKRFKRFALRKNILTLTAAQINRGPAQRTDHRPLLSDLRESAEIGNSSDAVVLIYREERYDPEGPRAGEADFILAKNRHGQSGDTVTVASRMHLTMFASMAMV